MSELTITEFLEARIAEDEAVANLESEAYQERMLAECAAKQAVIEAGENCETYGDQVTVLRALATAYKDHPDYDRDWAL